MNINKITPYSDDEGIAVDIILDSFGYNDIQVIYLESDDYDAKMKEDINFIISHQVKIHEIIESEIIAYINRVYKNRVHDFLLMKIYLFPDVENEFGFLFRWSGDTEHGIGVKLKDLSVKKIGSSEIAFI